MSQVMLVRHGQAQTGAQDEASYDALSPLGFQQARWLGDYIAGSCHVPTRIISGTMRRQQETAGEIAEALGMERTQDARLNEINYFALAESMQDNHAVELPQTRAEFLLHMPQTMAAWRDGSISCPNESFADYEGRVLAMLEEAEKQDGTMLVTSGGIIGMAMRYILGLELDSFSHVLLQTNNASLHRYEVELGQRRLMSFNGTPHLDSPERVHARTFT